MTFFFIHDFLICQLVKPQVYCQQDSSFLAIEINSNLKWKGLTERVLGGSQNWVESGGSQWEKGQRKPKEPTNLDHKHSGDGFVTIQPRLSSQHHLLPRVHSSSQGDQPTRLKFTSPSPSRKRRSPTSAFPGGGCHRCHHPPKLCLMGERQLHKMAGRHQERKSASSSQKSYKYSSWVYFILHAKSSPNKSQDVEDEPDVNPAIKKLTVSEN